MSVGIEAALKKREIFKDAITNMRKGQRISSTDCPLNSSSLGIISENDHLTRKCLCPLCTCGKHICPSAGIPDPYPISTFNSQYMNNYQPRSPEKTLIPKNRGNFFPSVPFDFETTSSECYKPHLHSSINAYSRHVPNSPPKTPFNAKSSYANNFVNWGSGITFIVKKSHEKHTTDEVKLNSKTSYRDNYIQLSPEDAKIARPETVKKGKNTHIDPKAAFAKDTTNRREFVDFSKKCKREQGYKPDNAIPRMKSVDNHYVTTNKSTYHDFVGDVDHRVLRKIMEKEGLIT